MWSRTMIVINGSQNVKNKFQNIFITVDVDGPIKYTHTAPIGLSGQGLQDYVDSREDQYKLNILKDLYSGCPSFGDLESMEQWIADGHKIIIGYDEEEQPIYEVIEKVPWTSTHPDIFPATGAEAINLKAAAKDLVENLTYDDIDDHIDNVFSNLNTDQKNSLKKLYKVVLFLAKR